MELKTTAGALRLVKEMLCAASYGNGAYFYLVFVCAKAVNIYKVFITTQSTHFRSIGSIVRLTRDFARQPD